MLHRCRLSDAITIRAGERSRMIAPGELVDLSADLWPGYPLAQAVAVEWFEPVLSDPALVQTDETRGLDRAEE